MLGIKRSAYFQCFIKLDGIGMENNAIIGLVNVFVEFMRQIYWAHRNNYLCFDFLMAFNPQSGHYCTCFGPLK